jgi:hypothetical protein
VLAGSCGCLRWQQQQLAAGLYSSLGEQMSTHCDRTQLGVAGAWLCVVAAAGWCRSLHGRALLFDSCHEGRAQHSMLAGLSCVLLAALLAQLYMDVVL